MSKFVLTVRTDRSVLAYGQTIPGGPVVKPKIHRLRTDSHERALKIYERALRMYSRASKRTFEKSVEDQGLTGNPGLCLVAYSVWLKKGRKTIAVEEASYRFEQCIGRINVIPNGEAFDLRLELGDAQSAPPQLAGAVCSVEGPIRGAVDYLALKECALQLAENEGRVLVG